MVPLSWYLIFAAALFSIGLFGVLVPQERGRDLAWHRIDAQRCEHQPGCLLAIWGCYSDDRTGVRDHCLRGGCGGSGCGSGAGDLCLSPSQHSCGG